VGSDAADSLFLVAFRTDTLRESSPGLFAALQFRNTRDVERLRRHAGKILKETRISRDGLDHILDAVRTQTPVGAGRDVAR
jgi:mevalonate kinase